jgi:hypothetical protein
VFTSIFKERIFAVFILCTLTSTVGVVTPQGYWRITDSRTHVAAQNDNLTIQYGPEEEELNEPRLIVLPGPS